MNSRSSKKISWTQGLVIALGVPMLILPSIGYFASYMWGFSIIIWLLSIIQGFMQNLAYGDLALIYPEAKGLPGFAQAVFKGKSSNDYDLSKFIGGFSAWGYWFAWNPVLAIFSLLISKYLHVMIPSCNRIPDTAFSITIGAIIFTLLIIVNWKGLSGGAAIGNILALFSLTPLLTLSIVPFFKGQFHFTNITGSFFPADWNWNIWHLLIFLGIMAMAQWSACAWETTALYAPEYENPKKNLPCALFSCGLICLVTFLTVQISCVGTLGIKRIVAEPYSPMLLMAKISLGTTGAVIGLIMLTAAMILVIQTALLGSAKSMQSMASEGNLPKVFNKTNKYGTPVVAMITISSINLGLIFLGTPTIILAGSAMGYVIANGISLFAYFKAKKEHAQLAPKWWKFGGLIFGFLNIPFYLIGLVVINSLDYGKISAIIGVAVIFIYIPLWFYAKKENVKTSIKINMEVE